jgi:hypothetical protein
MMKTKRQNVNAHEITSDVMLGMGAHFPNSILIKINCDQFDDYGHYQAFVNLLRTINVSKCMKNFRSHITGHDGRTCLFGVTTLTVTVGMRQESESNHTTSKVAAAIPQDY